MFRFANRIPLLFEPGSDVVTKQAQELDWGRYKIDKGAHKVGIFVSVVSTRIPFRGTGKEHIAEDVKELADEVRWGFAVLYALLHALPACAAHAMPLRCAVLWLMRMRCACGVQVRKALQQCALQLSKKLAKRQARHARTRRRCCLRGMPACCAGSHPADVPRVLLLFLSPPQLAKQRKARKKALTRYIPDAARAVFAVLAKARAACMPAAWSANRRGRLSAMGI